jgi:hypothetical protein
MSSMNRNMSSEQSVDETVDGAQDQRPLEPQSSDDYELEAAEKECTPTPSVDTTTAEPSEPVRQIPRSEATAKRGELDTHLSDEYVAPPSESEEAKWIARQAFGRNYSSTSTVYLESSIKNPDRDQILFW